MHLSSAKNTKRKKRKLHTFAKQKVTKQQLTNAERQKKIVSLCLRKRLLAQNGLNQLPTQDQYLELPRAIADANGMPHKSEKRNARQFLHERYEIMSPHFPTNWFPDVVILEGMFMIQSTPFPGCTMKQYSAFLLDQYVQYYIQKNVAEIHIVFDHANRHQHHPKQIERACRNATCIHNHTLFHDALKAPTKWRDHLDCSVCKRRIVNYVGDCLLKLAPSLLSGTQKIVVSGFTEGEDKDKAFYSTCNKSKTCDPTLQCNAEEADTRLWLHAIKSEGRKKLVFSPDTDILFIGLGMVNVLTMDVVIQVNKGASDKKFVHLNALVQALSNDVDLNPIPTENRPKVLQSLFVLSGCDFTSSFVGFGKVAFFKAFYAYSEFISGESGALSHLLNEESYLAFLRMIGVMYFQKHRSTFSNYHSPMAHFHSHKSDATSIKQQHLNWIDFLRQGMWDQVTFEDQLIPSNEALYRHYLRSSWVIDYWRKASNSDIQILPVTMFGWKLDKEGALEIEWDSDENIKNIKERVTFLLRGCKCTKSKCSTRVCSCRKAGRPCGPGCSCTGCTNKPSQGTV